MKKETYATSISAGLDLLAQHEVTVPARGRAVVNVGKYDLMDNDAFSSVVGLITPKSGLSFKHNIVARIGVVDQDYEGDVKVILDNLSDTPYHFDAGDKVAQLLLLPFFHLNGYEVEDRKRGTGGFGHTGR